MRAVTGCFGDRQLVLLRATIGDRGVRVVLGPTLAQLQLPGLEGDLDRHWFELLLDATAGLRASSACTLHWNLQRGVWLGDKRDVFTAATSWAYALLFGDRRTAAAPQMKDAASAIMRQVYASLSEVARAAADCCDQSARRLTMRFLPSVRLAVYCRIMRDTTGRIAQLAEVCPGAIIFCLGLLEGAEPPEIAAAERLFADVIAGRRLDHALDTVLDSWATRRAARAPCHPQSIRMQTERERMMGRAWKRLADASPVERLRILNAQRLLIRRAGALVPASLLVLPPPVGFAPEDIPRTPRANAAWFQLMKRLPLLEVGADSVAARNLSMLVSRQGLDLCQATVKLTPKRH